MVNPKVKAAYEFHQPGNVTYCAFDLSDYDNDVKSYTRKLEIFRTDTNVLIRSRVLLPGDYFIGLLVQSGPYITDPYLNNLGIKAVLSINDVVVAEDEIEFISMPILQPVMPLPTVLKRSADNNHYFSIKDNINYPINGLDIDDYERFVFALRRSTSDAQANKLEYIKELDSETILIEFDYFNEFVVNAVLLLFDKTTHQVFTLKNGSIVNPETSINQYYTSGVFNGLTINDPLGDEDLPIDLSKLEGVIIEVPDLTVGFSISKLVSRFEHYAKNLKEIKHNPTIRRQNRFFHIDLEALQDALTDGTSFPAIYLQTPAVEKAGAYDNMSEQYGFTFVLAMQLDSRTKAELIDTCKKITDKILNRLMLEVTRGIIPGVIDGTDEGIFGPVGDGLFGWAVSISISDGYNAEAKSEDWEDVI